MAQFDIHHLSNGMTILGEQMENVESVSFGFMLPAGASLMPQGCCGAGNVISDWVFRGAGERTSKELVDALEHLGLHRNVSVGSSHMIMGSSLECENLAAALFLYSDVLLRPRLTDDQFEDARELAIESVLSLDDDPRHRVMLELRENFYPHPLGVNPIGRLDDLKTLTAEKTRHIISERFDPGHSIFALAGKYDFHSVCSHLETLFGQTKSHTEPKIVLGPSGPAYEHFQNEGAQVHIGLMTPTVKLDSPDYYDARVAVGVLSGGMSARLFTEVREKRGLCYSVGARYHSLKEEAGITCYAGTTPDKAQETLDLCISEFRRLLEGITFEELNRAKVGLKSSLILNSESSSSRAGSNAADWYMLGRIRSLDEIKDQIENITVSSVLSFLERNRFNQFTVVTIGPKEVKVN